MRRALALLLLAAALTGCAEPAATAAPYSVVWQEDSHALLTLTNPGEAPKRVDAILATLRASGPEGPLPMFWAGADGRAPVCAMGEPTDGVPGGDVRCASGGFGAMPMSQAELPPGGVAAFRFHALVYEDGTGGLMLTPDASVISDEMPMHRSGDHVDMPPGTYVFVVDGMRVPSPL